jgi:hypothetical protein
MVYYTVRGVILFYQIAPLFGFVITGTCLAIVDAVRPLFPLICLKNIRSYNDGGVCLPMFAPVIRKDGQKICT